MSIEDFKKYNKKKAFKKRLLNIIFIPILILIFLMYGKKTLANTVTFLVVMNFLMIKKNFQTQKLIIIWIRKQT